MTGRTPSRVSEVSEEDREALALHLWDEGLVRPEEVGRAVVDSIVAEGWRPAGVPAVDRGKAERVAYQASGDVEIPHLERGRMVASIVDALFASGVLRSEADVLRGGKP